MERLEALLDEVAEALTTGNFAALTQLAPQIDSISIPGGDARFAESVLAKAQRNARLIEAASRGIRAARLRMSEITRGPELNTYNALGQKAPVPIQGAGRTHRV